MELVDKIMLITVALTVVGFGLTMLYLYIKVYEVYGVPHILVTIKNGVKQKIKTLISTYYPPVKQKNQ